MTQLSDAHRRLEHLCDTLEAVADALPANVSETQSLTLADELEQDIADHAALVRHLLGAVAYDVSGLRVFHLEDRGLAEDLVPVLRHAAGGEQVDDPECLGYMLRCLFGGMRRNIALEWSLTKQMPSVTQRRPALRVVPN